MNPHKHIEDPLIGTISKAPDGPDFVSTRGRDHVSPRVTIEALPDDTLLDIFYFRLQAFEGDSGHLARTSCWIILVHVCQRWRYVVFASPVRLGLCLSCTIHTPVREMLDVWPPLPIEIRSSYLADNILDALALEHRDRVRKVSLWQIRDHLEYLVPLIHEHFPALERLTLSILPTHYSKPVFSSSFLGGSAPRLRSLTLSHIPLPTLPQLLSSSHDLAYLSIEEIPYGGYISPEAMATCICALTRLTYLCITFEPTSLASRARPGNRTRGQSPLTPTVLASLTNFKFNGDSRYLEWLVAQIEAPALENAGISFVDLALSDSPNFDLESLVRFIDHSPTLLSYHRAVAILYREGVEISFYPMNTYSQELILDIPSDHISWQLPSLAQICSNFSSLLSGIEELDIQGSRTPAVQVDRDDAKWLDVFRPLTSVQTLEISGRVVPCIVWALWGLGEEVATMLFPALDNLYIEERCLPPATKEEIGRFITTHQRSDHPVTVHYIDLVKAGKARRVEPW